MLKGTVSQDFQSQVFPEFTSINRSNFSQRLDLSVSGQKQSRFAKTMLRNAEKSYFYIFYIFFQEFRSRLAYFQDYRLMGLQILKISGFQKITANYG
jgi:hypothetical protein